MSRRSAKIGSNTADQILDLFITCTYNGRRSAVNLKLYVFSVYLR